LILPLLAAVLATTLTGATAPAMARPESDRPSRDLVETAAEAGSFNTLAKALQAGGLVEALKGPGPFTVFAPTDEAFAKLPAGTLETLLKPENRPRLVEILKSHVVAGRVEAAQVLDSPVLESLQGGSLLISDGAGGPRVDNAKILKTDVQATNGVIHVIDTVLMPKDIVETAKVAGGFDTLLAAAKAAGLVEALKGPGPLTVFAPTDEAFAALPAGTVEDLLRPENRDRLAAILKYHVVSGEIVLGHPEAQTLQGDRLDIRASGQFRVDEANVLLPDVRASNGVVHVIDKVLMPALPEATPVRRAMSVIELAIERGVPLFNSGNPEACAAIYEVAARSLLEGFEDVISDRSVSRLQNALEEIRKDHRPRSQAWTLRRALDDVYASLRKQDQ
jgi:uncharacterized surface protein with fasciclin (FAS1) repeats